MNVEMMMRARRDRHIWHTTWGGHQPGLAVCPQISAQVTFEASGTRESSGGDVPETVKTLTVSAEQAAELEATVWFATGKPPHVCGFHGQSTPDDLVSLSCRAHPEVVAFELCVMLAGDVAAEACRAGYRYGASDFVEEMRQLVVRLGVAQTEAVGREMVFYWPTVVLVD